MEQLLSQLRDIHLPATVNWWPPAWGWWLLSGVAATAASLYVVWRWWRRRRANRPSELALLEVQALSRRYEAGENAATIIAELSVLLRRVALSYFPRAQVASMTGDAWLRWLDDCAGEPLFAKGQGATLNSAPYRQRAAADAQDLLQASRRWLSLVHSKVKKP